MLVRILKDWSYPDFFQQTPGRSGIWKGIRFTEEPVNECDFLIVTNRITSDIRVYCPPENIWCIIQEPPVKEYKWLRKGMGKFALIISPDVKLNAKNIIHSHGALPWHVNKTYDALKKIKPIIKTKNVSWITSNDNNRNGQFQRMKFYDFLVKQSAEVDIFGKGIYYIKNKWDALAPYKYSLAIENFRGPYYWTEKISDVYLAWGMPIYYGCTNILDYFPEESMVKIDINKPEESLEIIHEAILSNRYKKNLDAIEYSRNLILDKYQFFPKFYDLIQNHKRESKTYHKKQIELTELPWQYPDAKRGKKTLLNKLINRARRI